ncbi:hypothetical protein P7K49_027776 [Saguinus oedipus]|uniref:Uncharacterized protein n=1 Tax=Saguinus oedipus TaxID=9490 RepID=A0ABQ9UAF3_SAGOE|nr:hypothetical protein P7K49_027776 [Saguinus oedipus]
MTLRLCFAFMSWGWSRLRNKSAVNRTAKPEFPSGGNGFLNVEEKDVRCLENTSTTTAWRSGVLNALTDALLNEAELSTAQSSSAACWMLSWVQMQLPPPPKENRKHTQNLDHASPMPGCALPAQHVVCMSPKEGSVAGQGGGIRRQFLLSGHSSGPCGHVTGTILLWAPEEKALHLPHAFRRSHAQPYRKRGRS